MKKKHLFYIVLMISFGLNIFSVSLSNSLQASPLKEKAVITSTKRIKLKDFPTAFNPSLFKTENGFILVFRYCPGPMPFVSRIGLVELDENLDQISEPELLSTRSDTDHVPSQSEDSRIFSSNGQLYLLYNDNIEVINPHAKDRRDMFLAKLNYEDGHYIIAEPKKLIHEKKYDKFNWQKNWVPFDWNNNILFGYSINPHEIITPNEETGNCDIAYKTKANLQWKFGELRGGTPAFLVDGEYLAFFHSSVLMASSATNNVPLRHYFMGAYTFSADPPFHLTSITQYPLLDQTFYTNSDMHLRAIFPGGYAVSGSTIYIAYGKDDREVWIAKINKNALKKLLQPIQ